MQPEGKIKDKIYELQKYLDNVLIPDNLNNETVLEISRELDILIVEFYSGREEEKKASNF